MSDPYPLVTFGLLLVAALTLYLPVLPGPIEIGLTEIGYLRGGTKGAVVTALAALNDAGLIKARGRAGIRRTGGTLAAGAGPFVRAVYGTLHNPARPRALAERPAVRRARESMVRRLTEAGLVTGAGRRWFGRALLLAVLVLAVLRPGTAAITAGLIAAGLWLPARRTIAGHGVSWTARREHNELLGGWRHIEATEPSWRTGGGDHWGSTGSAGAGDHATPH